MKQATRKYLDFETIAKLTPTQQEVLCSAINSYGTHAHPMATRGSLRFFSKRYAIDCLKLAIKRNEKCDMGSVIEKVEHAKKIARLLEVEKH